MELLARTFRGVIPLLTSRANTYLIVLCAIAAAALVWVASLPGLFLPRASGTQASTLFLVGELVAALALLVIWGVTFEGAVRTVRPTFRLGPFEFAMIALLAFGRYLAVSLGALLLVLPGIFVTVRFSPLLAVYALDERRGANAVSETWFLTSGHFWLLFGIEILTALALATVAGILGGACGVAIAFFPPSVVVVAPLIAAVAIYILTAYHLLFVEVIESLRAESVNRGIGFTGT